MLTVLFELLTINVGQGDHGPPQELVSVVNLLRALACENNLVKLRLFDCFTTLLQIRGLENHIASLLQDVRIPRFSPLFAHRMFQIDLSTGETYLNVRARFSYVSKLFIYR